MATSAQRLQMRTARRGRLSGRGLGAWEEATAAATHAGIRTVLLRFGLVLNADGGVLKNLVMPGGLAVVGRLGNGSHKMSWISLTDAVDVMMACLKNSNFAGPLNVVAPEVVSNRAFAEALSKARRRCSAADSSSYCPH